MEDEKYKIHFFAPNAPIRYRFSQQSKWLETHIFNEENFVNFSKQIESNNFPKQRVKNYYYFQIGRWDLQLLNGQIIKFPSNKTVEAIKQAVELLKKKDFKSYNIIDLRMHGKIVVE